MKDTQITRAVYGDSHAFKKGVEVGRKEMIENTINWLKVHTDWLSETSPYNHLIDEYYNFFKSE